MDTVIPGGGDRRGDRLPDSVEAAQQALQRAASAAFLKGDPMAEQMQAMARSLGAQYDIFCAAKAMQTKLEQSVHAQTSTVTDGVFDLIQSSLSTMTKELGPQLLKAALPTMQTSLRFMKYRAIYWALLAMAALIVISGMFSYAVGLNHGRYEGESAAQTIRAAMTAGPDAAADWALLMADNNPVSALTACRKNVTTDEYGRRSCSLPIWLDPPMGSSPPQ